MTFAYDEIRDSILLFNRKNSDKMKGSAKVNNLIIDFTDKGKVVGLEIQKATQFFKDMHMGKSPENIMSAALSVKQEQGVIILFVDFKFEDREEQRAIYVSSESPTFAEV